MITSQPKFWAGIGFVLGIILASGGKVNTPLDALLGGVIQGVLWFSVSSFIIKRKASKK
jgi:hypothetical protein